MIILWLLMQPTDLVFTPNLHLLLRSSPTYPLLLPPPSPSTPLDICCAQRKESQRSANDGRNLKRRRGLQIFWKKKKQSCVFSFFPRWIKCIYGNELCITCSNNPLWYILKTVSSVFQHIMHSGKPNPIFIARFTNVFEKALLVQYVISTILQ